MNIFEITLDVDKRPNRESVNLRQGDVNGTTIRATLRDHDAPVEGGEYTGFFCMTLPDRKTYYRTDATYENGVVEAVVDERIAAAIPGATNNAYFELYDGEELKYTTASFIVRIKSSVMDGAVTAHSYDSRVETIMGEMRAAMEKCVPPTVTVEEVSGGHTVTITCPESEGSFTVLDGVDGEKGEKGDKGDTGDPASPDSITMAQLSDEVRERLNSTRLYGTLTDKKPSASDAYPSTFKEIEVYGLSVQDGVPTPQQHAPIVGVTDITMDVNGSPWAFDMHGVGMKSARDAFDTLRATADAKAVLTQHIGYVDLGELSWQKTNTKTGGMSRYYTTDLNGIAVPAISNSVIGNIACDGYAVVSAMHNYNIADDYTVAISSAGTVYVYDARFYGSMSTVEQFTESVSGVTLFYELIEPVVYDYGLVELPGTESSNVSIAVKDANSGNSLPYKVTYERDIALVIANLESKL